MLRVLLVCQDVGWNIGWSFRRLLPALGCVTWTINTRDYFHQENSSVWRLFKALVGPKWSPFYSRFNKALVEVAISFQPDLLLVLKDSHVSPQSLNTVRCKTNAKLVNYSKDTFFSRNPRISTSIRLKSIPLYDLVVTMRHILSELEAAGARRAEFVLDGYDPLVHYPIEVTRHDMQKWQSDLVFIGSYEARRAELLERLARQYPHRLTVYGGQWDKVRGKQYLMQCTKQKEVYGIEKILAMGCSKVCLNFLREANRDTYTARTFEIPACGSFMLAERSTDHQELLGEGEGFVGFDPGAPEELVDKVAYYLADRESRTAIAEEGFRRITGGRNTYRDRLTEILNLVREI